MTAVIIGISSGLLVILTFGIWKAIEKSTIYGLILSGIAFIYVGFTWTDITSLIISSAQVIFFVFIAYYGMKMNLYLLAAVYFLHGIWDLAYHLLPLPNLVPPHYDLFCLSIDLTMGVYLLLIAYRNKLRHDVGSGRPGNSKES
jgi:hypothetical protein